MTRRVTRYPPRFNPLALHVSSNRESGQTRRTRETQSERGWRSWTEIRELNVNEPGQKSSRGTLNESNKWPSGIVRGGMVIFVNQQC